MGKTEDDNRIEQATTRLLVAVKAARLSVGLSVGQLADKMHVSPSLLSMVLNRQRQPGLDFLRGILTAWPHMQHEVMRWLLDTRSKEAVTCPEEPVDMLPPPHPPRAGS